MVYYLFLHSIRFTCAINTYKMLFKGYHVILVMPVQCCHFAFQKHFIYTSVFLHARELESKAG